MVWPAVIFLAFALPAVKRTLDVEAFPNDQSSQHRARKAQNYGDFL